MKFTLSKIACEVCFKGLSVSSLVTSGLTANGVFLGIEGGFAKSTLSIYETGFKLKDIKPNCEFDKFGV